jgi:hypothetical protein
MRNTTRTIAATGLLAAGTLLFAGAGTAKAQGLGITIGRGGVTIGQPGYYAPGYYSPGYYTPGYYSPGVATYERGYSNYVVPAQPTYVVPSGSYVRGRGYQRFYTVPGYQPARVYTPRYYRVR